MKIEIDRLNQEIEELKAENSRYREALELIVDKYFDLPEDLKMYKDLIESKESLIAREALKGGE